VFSVSSIRRVCV